MNQDTGTGDPAPCDAPDFPSVSDIETVIDDTDVADGDTLVLCPGTYTAAAGGAVEVDKKLTIEGLAAADRDDIVVQGIASDAGIVISVDGVTIRHLKLAGADDDIGIRIESGADDNTIQDMEITAWGVGVSAQDVEGNVVETSDIHTNIGRGVAVANGAENVIRNNEVRDNANHGIDIKDEDQLSVEGNTLTGNGAAQMNVYGRSNVLIWNNNIQATTNIGVLVTSATADTLVQIGGSPANANTFTSFTGTNFYVRLDCDAENTVDATYNWWGSTVRIDIASRIFNDEDDAATECPAPDNLKGAVVFHPWATGPAPTPTATATGTPTPTATPGATRTIDLSPQGWHDLAWSGADATDPGTALACISGKYNIAYAWEGPAAGFKRYVEGCAIPGICTMGPLDKYDTLLVNISATGVTCQMPVVP